MHLMSSLNLRQFQAMLSQELPGFCHTLCDYLEKRASLEHKFMIIRTIIHCMRDQQYHQIIDIYKKPRCPTSYTTHVKIRSGS